ncbi:hypothetical protein SAMN05216388_10033 [Halorientalis persicus]|uniref:Uncharacterized protein n=1 Tax=Halorientalis persicus TaxID=1367881 RepID=A0A1H8G5F1_9EURY|nr:hypothetical protein [Halorientalis persicus]SEN39321.1 hypothetical protein SAMN05216388_10033 [Halorientalis persicus]
MTDPQAYRCLNCLDNDVTRPFNVSHLSRTCDACGEFGRFANAAVLDQFDRFETDPPAELEWDRLDRPKKLFVAERLVRHGYTLADFEIEPTDEAE